MKKILTIVAFATFSLIPYTTEVTCSATFCESTVVACSIYPCSTEVLEDGTGTFICGGITMFIVSCISDDL